METLILEDISAQVHLGVKEKERAKKQRILISVEIVPEAEYTSLQDCIENTVDYSRIRRDVKTIINSMKCSLIETLTSKIAHFIKEHYKVRSTTVSIKKFPYRDTKHVAYKLTI